MSIDNSLSADTAAVAQSRFAERLLIPAGFITTAGNAFQTTASAILVFRAGHTTLAVGWLFIAVAIPQVALSLLFGHLADKVDRRTLCIASDLASAVFAAALPVWLWLGGAKTLGSYLANFLLACALAMFMPASNALVKERVADKRIGLFNSHFEMATNAGMLIAASLAGFLVTAFGPSPLFIVNSLTFIASAGFTYMLGRKPDKAAQPDTATQAETSAAATAAPAPVRQPIKRLALIYVNWSMGLVLANALLTVLVLHVFHKGAWLVGVTDALAFAGFLIGAACYPFIAARVKGMHLALIGMIGNLVGFCLEPWNWIVLMSVIPVAAFFFAIGKIASRTMLTRASPEASVGRIFGGANAAGLAIGVAATVGFSILADKTKVPYAFWALSALQGAIAIGVYLSLVNPISARNTPSPLLETSAA